MPTLSEYGIREEPSVRKASALTLGERTVGHLAHDLTHDTRCYISERDTDDHRYHGEDPWYDFPFDGDGYGLSVELFKRIDGHGATRVYIAEPDTGDVYQFAFSQFVHGTPINFEDESDGRGYEKDPQKVVPIADAVEVWEDAHPDIYAKNAAFR